LSATLLALPPAVHSQEVDGEIRAEVTRYVQTVNRADADALAALYLRDPTTGSLGDGQVYQGWETIAELLTEVYDAVGTIQMTIDSVTVLPLGGGAAVAFFRYVWVFGSQPDLPVRGAMTLVYVRTPSGWRVAHDHTSSLPPNTPTTADAGVLAQGPAQPVRETTPCELTRIVDGDTIECRRIGRVRLIGMDTPEASQEPYAEMATEALWSLFENATIVGLEPHVELRDRYGRMLAYVWADGLLVNWALVRQGWAVVLTYPPNVQYVDWFTTAQHLAREEGVGLWGIGGFDCLPRDRRRGRCE
jgi:micrococcal nuclease